LGLTETPQELQFPLQLSEWERVRLTRRMKVRYTFVT